MSGTHSGTCSRAIPSWASDLDWHVLGSLGAVTGLDNATVRRLFAAADLTMVSALRRADPNASFEVLVGGDVISLWLADQRVAVVAAKGNRP